MRLLPMRLASIVLATLLAFGPLAPLARAAKGPVEILNFGNYRRVVYLAQSTDEALRRRAEAAAVRLGLAFEMRVTGLDGLRRFLARPSIPSTKTDPWPS